MRYRVLAFAGAAGIAAASASLMSAQAPAPPRPAPKAVAASASKTIPRTTDGHPDLTGVYDLATLTPVERPNGLPAVLTEAEAAKLEKQAAARREQLAQPSKGDRGLPGSFPGI